MEGRDSHDITRKSLRAAYTMVLQTPGCFMEASMTISPSADRMQSPEEVIEAAKAAKIHNYIMSLPDGYDTIVNGDGLNISQGQKQMLTIARAMLSDAKMLILDEATSNVDTRTEMQIQSAMRNLMKDKTCFVIATPAFHRTKRRHHPGRSARRHHRTGQPRSADEKRRGVCRLVFLPVPLNHLGKFFKKSTHKGAFFSENTRCIQRKAALYW